MVPAPASMDHSWNSPAIDSEPVSLRMHSGDPRCAMTSAWASNTSPLRHLRATPIRRHYRLYSSINGEHLLEFRVFALHPSIPFRFRHRHALILPTPRLECLLADVCLLADLLHGLAAIGQAPYPDHLFCLVSLASHVRFLSFGPRS